MSPLIIVLLVLAGIAVLVASTALVSMLQRRDVMLRASEEAVLDPSSIVLRPEKTRQTRLQERLEAWAREREDSEELQTKLIQAGFESPTAPAMYFLARTSSMVMLPLLAFILIPRTQFLLFVLTIAFGIFLGLIF